MRLARPLTVVAAVAMSLLTLPSLAQRFDRDDLEDLREDREEYYEELEERREEAREDRREWEEDRREELEDRYDDRERVRRPRWSAGAYYSQPYPQPQYARPLNDGRRVWSNYPRRYRRGRVVAPGVRVDYGRRGGSVRAPGVWVRW
ncbi:hypothetical protein Mal64_16390 [Pseudobythopirellula maris]|uniref:Uncharacterized protein n=1 Tax=Pseudobythopirellula maris TaxID=2527991 RepID=A0A5C5ZL47_9BACT|nr:hypothetical protein [Pseudobythopirellula maris]TWT88162.1 hypothetical protein Mal64_16390 [Pseudobythopirellula maris]